MDDSYEQRTLAMKPGDGTFIMRNKTSSIVGMAVVVATACVLVGAQGCRASGHATRQARTDAVLTEVAEAGAVLDLWRQAAERSEPGDRSLKSMAEEVFDIQSARLHIMRDRASVVYGGTPGEIDRFLESSEADRAALKEKVDWLREVILARISPADGDSRD